MAENTGNESSSAACCFAPGPRDLHPPDPLAWSLLGNNWIHSEPLYYKILGLPMACAHAELENVLRLIKERQLNF